MASAGAAVGADLDEEGPATGLLGARPLALGFAGLSVDPTGLVARNGVVVVSLFAERVAVVHFESVQQ